MIKLNKTPQELYNIDNDTCPICGKKWVAPINMFVHNRKGYCFDCVQEKVPEVLDVKDLVEDIKLELKYKKISKIKNVELIDGFVDYLANEIENNKESLMLDYLLKKSEI